MDNKLKAFVLFAAVLFVAGNVEASCEVAHEPAVGAVTFYTPTYAKACYNFKWEHSRTAADFNNFVIHTTGDIVIDDFNFRGSSFGVCTVEPGDSVTFFVRAHDGNADGRWCSYDYNVSIGSGTVTQAASYFVYALFAALAGIVGVFIILMLGLYVIKKFNIKIR